MSTHDQTPRSGLSRRQFLKGTGLTAATALTTGPLLGGGSAEAAQNARAATPGFGPGPVKLELTVNGAKVTTEVEPRVTLLDALRNYVDVTGPKRVCDRGTCGACTVLLDGKPIYACTCLALEAMGRRVETAEALNADGSLHAVPAAFVQFDAQQCGFCTPGFVMAIKAALDRNPKATPEELETAVCGNICRCGTYQQMRDAIRSLCKKMASNNGPSVNGLASLARSAGCCHHGEEG
ncbi:MAG: (2Fe-2S)-binding protein [Gemmatales bacterium]|nr:(2Fe-2S)-binding protein [Gemmatales bacterium]MDW8387551.1 (2Fe-2S)-binding protein [Gemmatales bacterium]